MLTKLSAILAVILLLAGCSTSGPPSSLTSHTAAPASLPYSHAPTNVPQSQPAPGSCHTRGTAPYLLPDPSCTPGALNPDVTQATISKTICVRGWTATIRPPVSVTSIEKRGSALAYGEAGVRGEYDHLVSLELGGAPNDPRNLWVEPGPIPNPKDRVENYLRQQICAGRMSLAEAQHVIASDWVAFFRSPLGEGGS